MLKRERNRNSLKICLGLGVAFILLAVNAQAAWWNPFPCVDQCLDGQVECTPDRQSASLCGDYDTLYDFDHCFEFPPDGTIGNTKSCPFGCQKGPEGDNFISIDLLPGVQDPWLTFGTGDICLTQDPCRGEGCNPGDTRCGRKCKEGTSCGDPGSFVDAMYICKKIQIGGSVFDCYGWDFSDPDAEECDYGCDESNGQCLSQNQADCSTCTPGITKCDTTNSYVIECIDKTQDGCFHWEQNQYDWQPCPNGCAQDFSIDGRAYCKSSTGETQCDECVFGGTRCNPNNVDYMQWCWEKDIFGCSSWTNDYNRFVDKFGFDWHAEFGQYCEFGCHLGKCKANPDPDVPELDACIEGQTRCAADGSNVVFCQEDSITGDLVWGNMKKCLSSKCQNGECVTPTSKGFDTITQGLPDIEIIQIWGMASDERFFYVTGLINTGIFTHSLITFDTNGSYVNHCFLNESVGKPLSGVTTIGDKIYVFQDNTTLIGVDQACNNISGSTINLDREVTGAAAANPRLTNNGTNFFINYGNVSEGVFVFDTSGNFEYSLCLIETSFAQCRDNQKDLVYHNNRIYFVHEESIGGIDTPILEIYGTDGYYFGNETLPIGEGFESDQIQGLAAIGNRLYFLWSRLSQTNPAPRREYTTDLLLSVYFLDSACKNTCNEGGSRCVGVNKEWKSNCVETPDGCLKYFDEVQHLFTGEQFLNNMEACGATQCKETWENHFILTAFCDEDVTCENVCEPGQYGCDAQRTGFQVLTREGVENVDQKLASRFTGSRYRVACILKDSPIPFNIGRQCFGWANPFDATTNSSLYEFCGQSHTCVDGQCVPKPDSCQLNESRCEIVAGRHYVIPCDTILGINEWSWGNRTLCGDFPCFDTFNATSELRTAECLTENSTAVITTLGIKNAIYEFNEWWNILWPDPFSQLFIMMILSVAAFVLLMPAGWQLGIGGGAAVFLGHLATGWLGGVFLFGILFLIALFVLPKMLGGDD